MSMANLRKTGSKAVFEPGSVGAMQGRMLETLESVLKTQRRMEIDLSALASDQKAIALALNVDHGQPCGLPLPTRYVEAKSVDVEVHSSAIDLTDPKPIPRPSTFLGKLAEAEFCIGRENILRPQEAKAFLDAKPDVLFLDISDGDAPTVPGTYRVPLGQLYCRASDVQEFKDPVLTDRDKQDPVLVTGNLTGVAKLACMVLLDYGFTHVKVVDGGNAAWKSLAVATIGPAANWPANVARRPCFLEEEERTVSASVALRQSLGSSPLYLLGKMSGDSITAGHTHSQASATHSSMSKSSTQSHGSRSQQIWGSAKAHSVISPCSSLRITLDVLSICVLVFDLVTVPWILAWDVKIEGWLETVSLFIACFWTFEILVTFRTGFFLNGELHMNPRFIARRYLKSWFFPDLAIVLLDWVSQVFLFIGSQSGDTGIEVRALGVLRFAKWSRLLRFFRMVRFMRFSGVFERILDCGYYSPKIELCIQVTRLLFIIFYLNHCFGCLLWGIGRIESDTGGGWVDLPVVNADFSYSQADPLFQYTASLQSAMTQILAGSMQVNATTSFEHCVSVFCLVTGVLFLSSLVSALAAKMTQMRMQQQDRNTQMSELREFLRRKAIRKEMGVNIIKQVDASLKEHRPDTMQTLAAWPAISQRNRVELHRELASKYLLRDPFLQLMGYVDARLVRLLCDTAVRICVHDQEDVIFSPNESSTETYMLLSGSLTYTQDPETSLVASEWSTSLSPASRLQWISEASLWTQWTHVGTLEASVISELLVLQAQTFSEVFMRNQYAYQLACEYSRVFHLRLQGAKPPYADWPNDVCVPYTSFEEVVTGMNGQVQLCVGLLTLQNRPVQWACHQRLQEEIEAGRCSLVAATNGDIAMVSSAVELHLSRGDGKMLMQIGTWEGDAASSAGGLPTTALRTGELPRAAYHRLLKQLCLPSESVRLEHCCSGEKTKAEQICVAKTMVTKHMACLDNIRWPSTPALLLAHNPQVRETLRRSGSWWEARSTGSLSTPGSPTMSFNEEIHVVAGEVDELYQEHTPQLTLRLVAWMEPAQVDLMTSPLGQAALRKFISGLVVPEEAVEEAKRAFSEGQRLLATL